MSLQVPVLFGSVRTERQGIKAARFVVNELKKYGCEPVLVDAKEYDLPLLDKMYKEYETGKAPVRLEELAKLYRAADGFAIVTGEYNHGVQPGLKNLLDYFLEEYYWRPSAIISYSGGYFGGARAAVQVREILGELGMPAISSVLPVPDVGSAFDDAGEPSDPKFRSRSEDFFKEFVWYMEALRAQRAKGAPPY
jgi:NAD(P)H-dependent FMN reductase